MRSHIPLGIDVPILIEIETDVCLRLEHTGTRSSRPVRVVEYSPYKVGEMPYATFQFFYRSQGR